MLVQDHLTLRLIRLKPSEEWAHKELGLAFLFAKGGQGKFSSAAGSHRFSPGDVLVAGEDARSKVSAGNGGDFVFWFFSLTLDHLFPLFAGKELSLLQTVAEGLKTPRLFQAGSALTAQCHRLVGEVSPRFTLDHRGQLLRIAAAILNEQFESAHQERTGFVRLEDHLLQVFEKLSIDDLVGLSVIDLAARFGCSRRHLNRLFHQYFGLSVAALRMEMRLLKAISLLRDPHAKIINVAEECGFNHLGLFNICFKRRFGTSPAKWRRAASDCKSAEPVPTVGGGCPLQKSGLCPLSGTSAGLPLPGNAADVIKASILHPLKAPARSDKPSQFIALPQQMSAASCKQTPVLQSP